jgi:hypothetical protein
MMHPRASHGRLIPGLGLVTLETELAALEQRLQRTRFTEGKRTLLTPPATIAECRKLVVASQH